MLYKLRQGDGPTTFVPVRQTTMAAQGLLEKVMEEWLAHNPQAVLPSDERVLVISQETAFQNLVDILGVDRDGSLVVIEVKRGQTPRDVIAQALEYASDVATWDYAQLNERSARYFSATKQQYESLLTAAHERFGMEAGELAEAQFNQRQRIFIVSETIEPKIERTARWLQGRGVEISCIRYQCYRTDEGEQFLDFEQVVGWETVIKVPKAGTVAGGPTSEDEFIQRMPPLLQTLYEQIRRRALSFGPDVSTGATPNYLKFSSGNNFAELHPKLRTARMQLYIRRPEGFSIPERGTEEIEGIPVTRVADNAGWALNHWFFVGPETSLDAVERLLRRSYDAVHAPVAH